MLYSRNTLYWGLVAFTVAFAIVFVLTLVGSRGSHLERSEVRGEQSFRDSQFRKSKQV